jgi:coatomer protein complex subunit gamma
LSYVNDDSRHSQAFDVSLVPKISREQAAVEISQARPSALESITASSSKLPESAPSTSTAAETQSSYASQLSAIPELEGYGPVLKSSAKPIALTESETEYVVTLVKHIYKEHVLFQFNVSNTIPDTVLEQVSVLMSPSEGSGLVEDFIIPTPSLNSTNGSGQVYVSFTREDPASYGAGTFACTLRFVSKEVDPSSGEPEEEGYQDEYQVEDCDLGAGDVSERRFASAPIADRCSTSPLPTLRSRASGTSLPTQRQ